MKLEFVNLYIFLGFGLIFFCILFETNLKRANISARNRESLLEGQCSGWSSPSEISENETSKANKCALKKVNISGFEQFKNFCIYLHESAIIFAFILSLK